MATIAAVAIKRATATARLMTALAAIGAPFGVEPPVLPTQGRDANVIYAAQMDIIADWAEKVAEAVAPKDAAEGETEDYADWTRAEMMKEFETRKIALDTVVGTGANGNVLVEDLRAALMADDTVNAEAESDDSDDDAKG